MNTSNNERPVSRTSVYFMSGRWCLGWFFVLVGMACNTSVGEQEGPKGSLFRTVPGEESGVLFENTIVESAGLNGILYEYLYNGGGVAAGDLNGDGLPDLYFVSNLEKNRLYLNHGNLRFHEVTDVSGVGGSAGFPTGVTLVDINSDGLLDIYVCKSGKYSNPQHLKNELYVNQGVNSDGIPAFVEQAARYGLDLPHHSTQAAFFDYDRDGDLDMFLLNHGVKMYENHELPVLLASKNERQAEKLYENRGGHFKDVSDKAGIIQNALGFGLGVGIGDVNNDGWPDVLVSHDFSEKDHLYLNQKDGTFREVIRQATGHISFFSMGNDLADFNNDGWLDFMTLDMAGDNNYDIKTSMSSMDPDQFYRLVNQDLHHQYMFNCLQLNNGIPDNSGIPLFSDIAQLARVSSTDWSWGPLFFDADNDGFKDLFISNGVKRDFRNNDFALYKQKVFDEFFNNFPDNTHENKQRARQLTELLIEKMPERPRPNYFFRNTNGYQFEKTSWATNEPNVSNGAIYSDLDLDGDLDLVLNNMDQRASIYENLSSGSTRNGFIQVRLKGSDKNPFGTGARVTVAIEGNKQLVENHGSRGFQSASVGLIHFGIGTASKADLIEVRWPDGRCNVLEDVVANTRITVSHSESMEPVSDRATPEAYALFKDITAQTEIDYRHVENEFDDFSRESLLPHRMSRFGPALAVADVNGDGLEDIYAGGAAGTEGQIFLQMPGNSFQRWETSVFSEDAACEDVSALFVDMDGDGDADLYVVSGGNEYESGTVFLKDRIYENRSGTFTKLSYLDMGGMSGSVVSASDFDKDGDLDLFVGGRQEPGHYPAPASSYLYRNTSSNGRISYEVHQHFEALGMVTDVTWADLDQDGWEDLLAVGEWMHPVMLQNDHGMLTDKTLSSGLTTERGWWRSVVAADFDRDGDIDFVAGNNGLNYKYKATREAPFEIYLDDFDQNGAGDIVLAYMERGTRFPLRGRECSSGQMPFIKKSLPPTMTLGKLHCQKCMAGTSSERLCTSV